MNKIIIASGPVIVKDNKVLLDISGDDKFWKFCGGQVKDGEDLREAAKNRAKEELGIDISITNEDPYLMYIPKPGEENIDVLLVHWLADYSGEIVPGEIVKDWAWLDIKTIENNNIAPNVLSALKHFGY